MNKEASDAREQSKVAAMDAGTADSAGDRLRVESVSLPPPPAAIPELPSEARHPSAPPWCSPTCLHGLMIEREIRQKRMMTPK